MRYNTPRDNMVNNFQACQWVSEFCEKYNYSVAVTSTWRFDKNWEECLRDGGLRDDVEIVGRTKQILEDNRSDEISLYLKEHPEVENFIILDDDYIDDRFKDNYIWCDPNVGFGLSGFIKAEKIHESFQKA